jgi:predicted AlkP superfamily phosphohydrolase/phosphomutase
MIKLFMRKNTDMYIIGLSLILFFAGNTLLQAYVGPGAGFAFAGSFFFIFIAFFLALFYFVTFPIRAIIRFFKGLKSLKNAKFKRVVIIGFDGVDYNLLNRFMKEGKKFPNFEKLAKDGTFAPLLSTEPPISPVAWSTFSTGVNPGKHNIFDFLTTDRNTYMPKLACSDIVPPKRTLKIGKYTIPLSRPKIELKRKSKSFWKIVGSKGIFSSVLRVPFTFPPEKFHGLMLSGLGTPDLRGAQGSFSFYSDVKEEDFDIADGVFEQLRKVSENTYEGSIKGPGNPFVKDAPPLGKKFKLTINKESKSAVISIGREKYPLEQGKLSDWNQIDFKAGLIKISGICQWVLQDVEPVKLYLSPLNIDPEKPSMPISHPKILSVYLSKLYGSYATLGMAEDTWAMQERVLSEEAFLQQVYTYQKEREKVFYDTFKRYKKGLIVQVFESTDRIQHMFWRYMKDSNSKAERMSKDEKIVNAIYYIYKAMDDFLGTLLPKLNKKDLLMIVSDHGFNTVNREFHLNTWLHKEGYLMLKDGKKASGKWYADVDWSKSRAYGQGLNGIFLNQKARERHGIVNKGKEAEALKNEIKEKLLKVVDPGSNTKVMEKVYTREEVYKGPYTKNAPDIVLGYNLGHRVSWESAVNYVGNECFTDSVRLWSGDHCFSNKQVPGIFFSNKKIKEKNPTLQDISPTVLKAFGIKPMSFIDGKDLEVN